MLQDVDAPAGTVYGVWLVRGSEQIELGTLTLDADGFGTFVLLRPLPFEQPERIEVRPSTPSAPVLSTDF
jgi:hypothetical protein